MESAAPYQSAWEFVEDQLRHLDLRLGLRARQLRRRRPEDPLDAFRGLVISDEEVVDLVDDLAARDEAAAGGEADAAGAPEPGDRWRAALEELDQRISARLTATENAAQALPLFRLARIFQLSPFEQRCLLLCLAPEVDRRYEKLFGYLEDDVTQKRPSVSLALDLFCATAQERLAARLAFDPQAPLFRFRLCQLSDAGGGSLLSRAIGLETRVTSYLLGQHRVDARLDDFTHLVTPGASTPLVVDAEVEKRIRMMVEAHHAPSSRHRNVTFHLHGPPGSGRRALAEAVCRDLGVPLLVADLDRLLAPATAQAANAQPLAPADAIWALAREAALIPAALCLEGFDALVGDAARGAHLKPLLEAVQQCSRLTFLVGQRQWLPESQDDGQPIFGVEVKAPEVGARRSAWERLGRQWPGMSPDVDWGSLASRFRFGPDQIRNALAAAENIARWRASEGGAITTADLDEACRATGTRRLISLARKLHGRPRWDELILPAAERARLEDLCNEARYRHRVLGDWGFNEKLPLGRGLSALFSGPPGTGKTMAAQVIAGELGLDLYRIDLSQVVSKYIGETEKHLAQVFDDAEATHAILFFDEADALFGKRSEVKDAHDRYANVEVGYLLQRMEEFDGTAILATNFRKNLDDAFIRRLRFVIEFPFPDEEQRRRLWQVTFPRHAPLSGDLDIGFLAREIRLSGGHIRNIGLASAFYAARDGGTIQMDHLVEATRREYEKLGKTWEPPPGMPGPAKSAVGTPS